MIVIPKDDYVLVVPSEISDRLESGLYVPQTAEDRGAVRCIVVDVGPGNFVNCARVHPGVAAGDEVLLAPYCNNSGIEVRISGKKHLLVRSNDIVAIIRD